MIQIWKHSKSGVISHIIEWPPNFSQPSAVPEAGGRNCSKIWSRRAQPVSTALCGKIASQLCTCCTVGLLCSCTSCRAHQPTTYAATATLFTQMFKVQFFSVLTVRPGPGHPANILPGSFFFQGSLIMLNIILARFLVEKTVKNVIQTFLSF